MLSLFLVLYSMLAMNLAVSNSMVRDIALTCCISDDMAVVLFVLRFDVILILNDSFNSSIDVSLVTDLTLIW